MTASTEGNQKANGQHTALNVEAGPISSGSTKKTVNMDGANVASLSTVLPKWWRLARIWFTGEERWIARGYAVAVISLALATTLFSVHISYAQRDFSTALSAKDVPGFYAAVRKFVVIICVAAPLFSFNAWLEDRLILAWRAHLTRRLTRAYFANRAFYHIRQRDNTEAPAGGHSSSRFGGGGGGGGGPAVFAASPASAAAQGGGIDNPDQRLCDDVGSFVRSSVSLSLTLCRKVFNCVAFAGVLWGVSGHLVLFLFVYAGVGTFVTTALFGRLLTSLYYRQLAREADLRFSLVRVRENAESIAFYRGEPGERARVLSRLAAALGVAAERIRAAALYDVWTSVYSYATILVPGLLTAPRYFAGEIEFGVISQASFAFSRIEAALSVIINNLATISGLAAETERLDALVTAMAAAGALGAGSDPAGLDPGAGDGDGAGEASAKAAAPGGASASAAAAAAASLMLSSAGGGELIRRRAEPGLRGLRLERLCVAAPCGGRVLGADISLQLEPGQSLLVVGPSGCGKSSLLRAVAGLWAAGSGAVLLPGAPRGPSTASAPPGGGGCSVFFLPQKPFMPLGDLRTQLTFPAGQGDDERDAAAPGRAPRPQQRSADAESGEAGLGADEAPPPGEDAPLLGPGTGPTSACAASRPPRCPSDEALLALLDEVCLPDLVARVGGLDVELDWSSVLSVGEQQRVAVLRLLAARPQLAFLDEATSALDGPTEARLYGLIRKRVPCYVSVGHRLALLAHHTHVLEALGGGAWRLHTAEEYTRGAGPGAAHAGQGQGLHGLQHA